MTRHVKRAKAQKEPSRQPRFNADLQQGSFGASLYFAEIAEIKAVPYSPMSMIRDQWLRSLWKLEPRLAGVMNAVNLIDSNRGWELVGGRNQVARYTNILHNVEGGRGWRSLMRKASLSYWSTDMGSVTEIGRDGPAGPMRSLYHVDSARCALTGKLDTPLAYYPTNGGQQYWQPQDYFRVCSMESDDEIYRGLGFCAVSRAVELTRILYAVMMHDQEEVGARMPKGLLLLQNVSQQQWEDAMADRDAALTGMERQYYGGVAVLAHSGVEQIDAKLIALSSLPANFDAKTFMDLTMYGYALVFGYDPSEFWPVQFGSLGRGTETEVQHQKATGKGGTDFALAFQEQLQGELPDTLDFQFEQRDDAGELVRSSVDKSKIDNVTALYTAGLQQGAPLITQQQALSLLAEQGIVPGEWTVTEEDVTATDTEDADTEEVPPTEEPARWLDSAHVQRAMALFPTEPIVRYQWPSNRMMVLWEPRGRPRFHVVTRADDSAVLYDKGGMRITEADVDKAIADGRRRVGVEFAQLLEAPTLTDEQLATIGAG